MTSNDTVKLGIKRFTAKPEIKHQIVYSREHGIPTEDEVLYVGAFVIDIPSNVKNILPFWPNKYMHHVTLAYKPDQAFIDKMFIEEYIGEESIITVCRVIHDHLGCTAIVMAEDELPCNSDTPHITIGTAEGIKPVYSNTLIVNYLGGYDDIFSADMSFDVDIRVGIMLK